VSSVDGAQLPARATVTSVTAAGSIRAAASAASAAVDNGQAAAHMA
jgi:hypothetical protein